MVVSEGWMWLNVFLVWFGLGGFLVEGFECVLCFVFLVLERAWCVEAVGYLKSMVVSELAL